MPQQYEAEKEEAVVEEVNVLYSKIYPGETEPSPEDIIYVCCFFDKNVYDLIAKQLIDSCNDTSRLPNMVLQVPEYNIFGTFLVDNHDRHWSLGNGDKEETPNVDELFFHNLKQSLNEIIQNNATTEEKIKSYFPGLLEDFPYLDDDGKNDFKTYTKLRLTNLTRLKEIVKTMETQSKIFFSLYASFKVPAFPDQADDVNKMLTFDKYVYDHGMPGYNLFTEPDLTNEFISKMKKAKFKKMLKDHWNNTSSDNTTELMVGGARVKKRKGSSVATAQKKGSSVATAQKKVEVVAAAQTKTDNLEKLFELFETRGEEEMGDGEKEKKIKQCFKDMLKFGEIFRKNLIFIAELPEEKRNDIKSKISGNQTYMEANLSKSKWGETNWVVDGARQPNTVILSNESPFDTFEIKEDTTDDEAARKYTCIQANWMQQFATIAELGFENEIDKIFMKKHWNKHKGNPFKLGFCLSNDVLGLLDWLIWKEYNQNKEMHRIIMRKRYNDYNMKKNETDADLTKATKKYDEYLNNPNHTDTDLIKATKEELEKKKNFKEADKAALDEFGKDAIGEGGDSARNFMKDTLQSYNKCMLYAGTTKLPGFEYIRAVDGPEAKRQILVNSLAQGKHLKAIIQDGEEDDMGALSLQKLCPEHPDGFKNIFQIGSNEDYNGIKRNYYPQGTDDTTLAAHTFVARYPFSLSRSRYYLLNPIIPGVDTQDGDLRDRISAMDRGKEIVAMNNIDKVKLANKTTLSESPIDYSSIFSSNDDSKTQRRLLKDEIQERKDWMDGLENKTSDVMNEPMDEKAARSFFGDEFSAVSAEQFKEMADPSTGTITAEQVRNLVRNKTYEDLTNNIYNEIDEKKLSKLIAMQDYMVKKYPEVTAGYEETKFRGGKRRRTRRRKGRRSKKGVARKAQKKTRRRRRRGRKSKKH